jgi:hypothetical protein
MANQLCELLEQAIARESNALRAFAGSKTDVRPSGDATWSPKEELGHLIDSAANNHIRFVRASIEPEFRGPPYAQNEWVTAHGYQEMDWNSIITVWQTFNGLLSQVIKRIPEAKLQTACYVGESDAVSLQFLIEDYVVHMQHHLDHLLGREQVTPYPPRTVKP